MSYIKVSSYYNELKNDYYCKKCDYNTSYKCNMTKHLKTKKHTNSYDLKKVSNPQKNDKLYECDCGKLYKYRQGLYLHKKEKCQYEKNKNMEMEISELKKIILEMSDKINTNNKLLEDYKVNNKTANVNNNCNNSVFMNSFNNKNEIKIFLTEQCADALSIQDFIKQLTITMEDINNTREGMVTKITTILERNLKPLSLTNRPIHHIEKDEWFMKDDKEWKEDDGDAFVNKAHNKYQTKYLTNLSKTNIENEIKNDEVLEQIKLNTEELTHNDRSKIKQTIKNDCQLSH